MSRYLIVGGVAAGMSAAARLRRLDETAEIVVLERGEYISYANCGLPYYIGDVITHRDALLLQTPGAFRSASTSKCASAARCWPSTRPQEGCG